MEYTLLILLLLIMIWINLRNKISKSQEKTEELSKEIAALRRRLEDSPKVADEVKEPEPETLKEPEVFVQPEPVKAIVEPARNLQPRKVRKPVNYEKYIGENLFGKIGILILVLGIGLFVKYAIDKEWINETLRTILGFGMGGLLLFVAWRLKDSYRTFSSLLAGGAFAIFYVTVAIAYHYYGLFSQTVAFILLVLFTGFMSSLSILYNRRELAIIALVGGFIAPFLVGSGDGSYWVLFTYVMILDLGMFGLSIYKKWGGIACNLFCLDLDRLCGLYVCCGSGFDEKCPINAFTYFLYRLLFDLLIIGRFHRANQYPGDQSIFIRSDRIEQFRIPVLCPLSPAEYGA